MTIRLYCDEDAANKGLVRGLRARGIDVQTACEAGMAGRADDDHLVPFDPYRERVLFSSFIQICRHFADNIFACPICRIGRPAILRGRALGLLIGITVVGAIVRLINLDHPCLWGDEAWVYGRICGSFGQMLGYLRQHDGFMPLLYMCDWCLGKALGYSPAVLRLIPTICGIVMIPAMYGLTVRLLGRRSTALWVAALTACSTFLAVYSRDAKPYMPLWCFEALSVGGLLWWLDERRWRSWIYWVIVSSIMVELHALGIAVLALGVVLRINSPIPANTGDIDTIDRKTRQSSLAAFWLGNLIILLGPALYYIALNHWVAAIRQQGWHASGLDWIADSISGHNGTALSLNTLCIFINGWGGIERGILPRGVLATEYGCFILILAALAWGLMPWRKTSPASHHANPATARRWARAVLWIGACVIVGPFIAYCISLPNPSTGWPIWIALALLIPLWWQRRPELFPAGNLRISPLVTCIVLFAMCLATWGYCLTHHVNPVWVPRYLGIFWPALAVGICALVGRIGIKPLRLAIMVLLLAVNCVHTIAHQMLDVEPRRDLLAADLLVAQDPKAAVRVYTGSDLVESRDDDGSYTANPVTRYYLARLSGKTMSPMDFRYGKLSDFFANWPTEQPSDIAADVAANPKLDRLIVWEILPKDGTAHKPRELLAQLGPQWRCADQQILIDSRKWGLGVFHRTQRCVFVREQQ